MKPLSKGTLLGLNQKADKDLSNFTYETDKYGFRNEKEFDFFSRRKREIRLGIFGASTVFGYGITEEELTLPGLLENYLNRDGEKQYKVVNLAIPGWHYPQQFLLFSRVYQHLDGIITFDGVNEIFVPLSNTNGNTPPLPPGFPWGAIYLTLKTKPQNKYSIALYNLLLFESHYHSNALFSQSGIYTWMRYYLSKKKRAEVVVGLQGSPKKHIFYTRMVPNTPNSLQEHIAFSVDEYVKYSMLMDVITKKMGIPILHILQPIKYYDKSIPCDKDDPFVSKSKVHPALMYGVLRKRIKELTAKDKTECANYLDFADLLPPKDVYWIDFVHTTPAGNQVVAKKIYTILYESCFLKNMHSNVEK